MKKLTLALTTSIIVLTGCNDGLTARQEACLDYQRDNPNRWEICVEGANLRAHQREMARIENRQYGNPSYTGSQGYVEQPIPQPMPMYQDNGFDTSDMALAAVGGALLGGYAMHKVNGKYMYKDRKGNYISHSEYAKRVRQSDNQKLKNALTKSENSRKMEIQKRNVEIAKLKKQNAEQKKKLANQSKDIQNKNNVIKQQKEKEKFAANKDKLKADLKKKQQQRKENPVKRPLPQTTKSKSTTRPKINLNKRPTTPKRKFNSSSRRTTSSKRR